MAPRKLEGHLHAIRCGINIQQRGVLGLSAGPAMMHNQHPGEFACFLTPNIALDET
jgi:hypothetical protein